MKHMKRIVIVSIMAFLFMIPISVMADENGDPGDDQDKLTVILDFGDGHEAFVDQWYKEGADSSVAGKYEYNGSKVYIPVDSSQQWEVYLDLRDYGLDPNMFGCTDNGEKFVGQPAITVKKVSEYPRTSDMIRDLESGEPVNEGQTFYALWSKPVTAAGIKLGPVKCGTVYKFNNFWSQPPGLPISASGNIGMRNQCGPGDGYNALLMRSIPGPDGYSVGDDHFFSGTIEGGKTYYAYIHIWPKLGYYFENENDVKNIKFEGLTLEQSSYTPSYYYAYYATLPGFFECYASFEAVHDPDANGICRACGELVDASGAPVAPGASAATAEKAITSMTTDTDPAGSVFSKLNFKSKKQAKNSITLSWNKVGNAKNYVIYGNKCGKGIKPVKIAMSTGNALAVKAISGTKLAKGTYYKFIIVALDQDNKVVSTSKLIHVATAGGKVGNHKKVTVKKAVTKKAKKLKKGKTLKLKAKAVKKSKKVKKHVGVRYESTNTQIATVSAKGVVKANNKGTCYVYAYAQNGVFKKIKVTVK